MDNNENRFSFDVEEPEEVVRARENDNYNRIKKLLIRGIAIGCAVCLLIGGTVGAAVGGAFKKKDSATAEKDSLIVESGVKAEEKTDTTQKNTSTVPTPWQTKPKADTDDLLYTAKGNGESLTVDEIVEKVENSVVAIVINYKATANYGFQTYYYDAEASGSGVIVSDDGYIVTNNHVVNGAETITVTLADGTPYEAKLIGADDNTDLALIKIEATGLTSAVIGDSTTLKKGQTTVIIGNPLGYLDGSVSSGIVSGLDRTLSFQDGSTIYHLIQTDASVNPGNSGGGLFNDKGELVGIVTAKASSSDVEGLGFAIPASDFSGVINDLFHYGYVKGRPALGVNTVTISNSMEAMYYGLARTGVYVQSFLSSEVEANSELKIGDCIISIDGNTISSTSEILGILSNHQVGETIEIEVYRSGETMTVKTTLVEQDANY